MLPFVRTFLLFLFGRRRGHHATTRRIRWTHAPRALPVTDFPTVNDRSDKGVAVYEHDGLLVRPCRWIRGSSATQISSLSQTYLFRLVVLVVVVLVVVLSLFLFLSTGVVPSISAPRLCVRVVKKICCPNSFDTTWETRATREGKIFKKRRESEKFFWWESTFLTFYFQIPL